MMTYHCSGKSLKTTQYSDNLCTKSTTVVTTQISTACAYQPVVIGAKSNTSAYYYTSACLALPPTKAPTSNTLAIGLGAGLGGGGGLLIIVAVAYYFLYAKGAAKVAVTATEKAYAVEA